jgi:hypothetical protein
VSDDSTLDDATLRDEGLRAAARRLGAPAAERLDVEAAARGVVTRLETEPSRGAWSAAAWLRIAAALLVLLGAGVVGRGWVKGPAGEAVVFPVSTDLAELGERDLERLLSSLNDVLRPEPAAEDDLYDLTEDQLRVVLRSLEG